MTEEVMRQVEPYYAFPFSEPVPYRDGFLIIKDTLTLHLKKAEGSCERVRFQHDVKEHLKKNGFPYTDEYVLTKEGLPYVLINEEPYTLSVKIQGQEASFENPVELAKSAIVLASMHLASRGAHYDLDAYPFATRELGNLPLQFAHRINELKKFKKMAVKGKSMFDYAYAKCAGYFIEEGERTLEALQASQYEALVARTRAEQSLCHHDFTAHNVILAGKSTYLTGLENCCIELKEYDLANFIRRKMRRTGWSLPDAKYLLDHYRSVCSLCPEELDVLRILLRFPQKLWRIVNQYYNSRRSWCERSCLEKMSDVLAEKEPLNTFLEHFDAAY